MSTLNQIDHDTNFFCDGIKITYTIWRRLLNFSSDKMFGAYFIVLLENIIFLLYQFCFRYDIWHDIFKSFRTKLFPFFKLISSAKIVKSCSTAALCCFYHFGFDHQMKSSRNYPDDWTWNFAVPFIGWDVKNLSVLIVPGQWVTEF